MSSVKLILTSDKMPENDIKVLVYGKVHFLPDHNDDINWNYDYDIGVYNSELGWITDKHIKSSDVIAWMPLPEEPVFN